jgi:hypothetical protein
VRIIHDTESLDEKINHLRKTFRQNRYSNCAVKHALVLRKGSQTHQEKPAGTAMLPIQQMVSNKISRLLAKHKIKTIHVPVKKKSHMLRPVKDKLGIYCVPCECSKVCVGQTDRSIENRKHEMHTPGPVRKVRCGKVHTLNRT